MEKSKKSFYNWKAMDSIGQSYIGFGLNFGFWISEHDFETRWLVRILSNKFTFWPELPSLINSLDYKPYDWSWKYTTALYFVLMISIDIDSYTIDLVIRIN